MKKEKNKSAQVIRENLNEFMRTNKYEWVPNALFSSGISVSIFLFASLLLQY